MNKASGQLGFVLAVALSLAAGVALADDATKPGEVGKPTRTAGSRLFDGQTLKGWKASENPEQWKVEDGKIVAAGPRSHLFYVGDDESKPAEFKNFHFKADVMTTPQQQLGHLLSHPLPGRRLSADRLRGAGEQLARRPGEDRPASITS